MRSSRVVVRLRPKPHDARRTCQGAVLDNRWRALPEFGGLIGLYRTCTITRSAQSPHCRPTTICTTEANAGSVQCFKPFRSGYQSRLAAAAKVWENHFECSATTPVDNVFYVSEPVSFCCSTRKDSLLFICRESSDATSYRFRPLPKAGS
jgi:hypothetical protein